MVPALQSYEDVAIEGYLKEALDGLQHADYLKETAGNNKLQQLMVQAALSEMGAEAKLILDKWRQKQRATDDKLSRIYKQLQAPKPSFNSSVLPMSYPTPEPTTRPSFNPSVVPTDDPPTAPTFEPTTVPTVWRSASPPSVPTLEPIATTTSPTPPAKIECDDDEVAITVYSNP